MLKGERETGAALAERAAELVLKLFASRQSPGRLAFKLGSDFERFITATDANLDFVAGETDSDLEAVCRRHLVPYKVPVRFEWLDRLPRSETGKVLRRELAARL